MVRAKWWSQSLDDGLSCIDQVLVILSLSWSFKFTNSTPWIFSWVLCNVRPELWLQRIDLCQRNLFCKICQKKVVRAERWSQSLDDGLSCIDQVLVILNLWIFKFTNSKWRDIVISPGFWQKKFVCWQFFWKVLHHFSSLIEIFFEYSCSLVKHVPDFPLWEYRFASFEKKLLLKRSNSVLLERGNSQRYFYQWLFHKSKLSLFVTLSLTKSEQKVLITYGTKQIPLVITSLAQWNMDLK